jgi:hypothetical protein
MITNITLNNNWNFINSQIFHLLRFIIGITPALFPELKLHTFLILK